MGLFIDNYNYYRDESRHDSVYMSGTMEVVKNAGPTSDLIHLEVRRVKFTKHAKEKAHKFYIDF